MNITVEKVKELEARKEELIKEITEKTEEIKQARSSLASKIIETEKRIEERKERISVSVVEEDIYNVEKILEAESKAKNLSELNRIARNLCKAYALNPYKDAKNSKVLLEMLEELKEICLELDNYYDSGVEKNLIAFKKAKKELEDVQAKRKKYRKEVLVANRAIVDAANFDILGLKLNNYNVTKESAGLVLGAASSAMSGENIVNIMISGIKTEMENAKKSREYIAGAEPKGYSDPFLISGEPMAVFSTDPKLQPKQSVADFFKKLFQ